MCYNVIYRYTVYLTYFGVIAVAEREQTKHTCCFIGHRTIYETEELKMQICEMIERLITCEQVDTFLFGSKGRFNSLCLELVSTIKEKHPHIKRVYVRAEFPVISDEYKDYLLERYEETYYPQKIEGAGKAAYVERNREMIDKSCFCMIYYDEKSVPATRKSGTQIALAYAMKQGKRILKLPKK